LKFAANVEMFCKGGVGDLPNELLDRAGIASGYDTSDKLGFVGLTVDDSNSYRGRTTMPEPVCEKKCLPRAYFHCIGTLHRANPIEVPLPEPCP
jgi:hypothetical protein